MNVILHYAELKTSQSILELELELTDKRCWFRPPFASIMRKPVELGNSVNE